MSIYKILKQLSQQLQFYKCENLNILSLSDSKVMDKISRFIIVGDFLSVGRNQEEMEKILNFLKRKVSRFNQPKRASLILFSEFFYSLKFLKLFNIRELILDEEIGNARIDKLKNLHNRVLFVVFPLNVIYSWGNFISHLYWKSEYHQICELSCAASGFGLVAFKACVVLGKNVKDLRGMVETLERHYPYLGWDQYVFGVDRHLKVSILFSRFSALIYALVAVTFYMMPFWHQLYGYIFDEAVEWEQVFSYHLPFDQWNPVSYSVIYLVSLWIGISCLILLTTVDSFFCNIMNVLCMEFEIVGQRLSEIDPLEDQMEAIKDIKKLVEIHQELIEVSEKLENIFSFFFLIDVFGIMALMGLESFLSVVSYLTFFSFFLISI